MKAITLGLAAVAAMAAPAALAQEMPLSDAQLELYSEMLIMSEVCSHVADFRVDDDGLQDFLTGQLARAPESDTDTVINRREAKRAVLLANAAAVRDMEHGNARLHAVDEHYARLSQRCRRMANNPVAGEFFDYRG